MDRRTARLRLLESTVIFALFAAAYFIVGYRVVVDQHLVNFDALSRLAHAYFVWYNDPAKLAAIGFVWPPVQTLVYLPFALIKPLATSLAAMPACSATFMAGTMVALGNVLRLAQMPWWARWPLLAAFGLNPMIVYYGANGMAEAVYLFFFVAGVYFFLRWYLERSTHLLALVGFCLAASVLARYEMLPFALLIGAAIVAVLLFRRRTESEIEGSLLLYVAPIAYAGASWLFFNWLILGDPFFFFSLSPTSSDLSTSQGHLTLIGASAVGPATLAKYLLYLNFGLFPLTLIIFPALVVSGAVRRDLMCFILAALVATNAVVTALLYLHAPDTNLLQLRYNMRAMPLAFIGVAWLYRLWRPSLARAAICATAIVVLVVTLPITWRMMQTYAYQYEENVFVSALQTGADQEGNIGIGGYPIGVAAERDMADYINAHVPPSQRILTDDAQTLGVMLLTGRPGDFLDRIDRGDAYWKSIRNVPWGKVGYMLVSTPERCRKPCADLIRTRYPGILENHEGGMHVVFRTPRYALVKVDKRPPGLRRGQ